MAKFLTAALAALILAASAGAASAHATLAHFSSEAELLRFFKHLPHRPYPPPPPPPAPPPPGAVASVAPMAEKAAAPGITNNQVSGVDEGDIVKMHGDALVILRRGRLFTVSLAGHGMKPIDAIDAYPPGVDAGGDWYDEMLVSGDRIVVIGYSYSRGGTQINRFRIDGTGHLKFEDAYQLRSNDYYSARNYASRLIGHQLILYSPRYLPYGEADPLVALPALRKWNAHDGNSGRFERIGTARQVYLAPQLPDAMIDTVHTITSCDLTAATLACKATSVLGPSDRVFFVSQTAVYVWMTPYWYNFHRHDRAPSLLYRLPLDGSAPTAIGVRGAPVDQFGFREDANMLDVLVLSKGTGDGMWSSGDARGAVALLRLPLDRLGNGMAEAGPTLYRGLPSPKYSYSFHNRFVGDYVLYGVGNDWGTPQDYHATLVAAPLGRGEATQLVLPHGVDRIEAMGGDAVIVGSDSSSVYFSAVVLGSTPRLGDRYVLAGAAQSETRSHGFFFKPEGTANDGVLGLPVSRPAAPGYAQLFDTSAAMIFLRRSGGTFAPLGELASHAEGAVDDHCVASCTDWYGNARPIFAGPRTFALMGYELVEGTLSPSAITETGRVSFAAAPGR